MGCQTAEGEDEFMKRYESWDDPDVPKFHYGSHYSSAGIDLFYLLRLPPFSSENQTLQGGQFDHAEFFYMPEFLENRFNLDLGIKQSGEKVGDVVRRWLWLGLGKARQWPRLGLGMAAVRVWDGFEEGLMDLKFIRKHMKAHRWLWLGLGMAVARA